MAAHLAITLPEYERLFRVIHSTYRNWDKRPGPSCILYNSIGAFLLEKLFKLEATPRIGAAFVWVNDTSRSVMTFAERAEDGSMSATEDKFHCWIETEHHIIDFTAPVYQEYVAAQGGNMKIPRKMFQKRKADMATTPFELHAEGEFFFARSPQLTVETMPRNAGNVHMEDVAEICKHWYQRPPKKMPEVIPISDDLGKLSEIRLTPIRVEGAW